MKIILPIIKFLIKVLPSKVIREIKDRSGKLYFRRHAIIETGWFAICVHEFFQDEDDSRFDKDPYLHNHPREFWTLILDNGYLEAYKKDKDDPSISYNDRSEGDFVFVDKHCFHQIYSLPSTKTYARTLTIGKKHTGNWGYLIDGEIVSNEDYRKTKAAAKN